MMNPTVETLVPPKPEAQSDPRRWIALGILLFAAFMDLVDATIVNVAIPSIQQSLGASYAQIQWVVAGYILAFALGLITGGRLGDIYGRKRLFLLGMAGFIAASLLCGLAPTPEVLIGARLLQGAFGAVMIPQVLSIIQVVFSPRELGAAFGMYGAVTGLAAIAGPILGGVLVQADLFGLGWRPIFLVNLPVGLLAFVAAALVLRESKAPQGLRLDLPGVALATLGLALLLYPLVQGRELGWLSWTFLAMALSLPVFALFVRYQRYKTRLDGSPLVALNLFKERAFVAGLLVSFIFFAGVIGFFLVFIIYLQVGLGFSALHAGLTGVPYSVGSFLASGASVALAPRFGRKLLSAGSLFMAIGMAGLILTIRTFGIEVTSWHLLPALFVSGLGMGSVVAPLVNIILAGVPSRDAGSASGVLNTVMQLGGAVGVALIGVVFFGLLSSQATASIQSVAPTIQASLQATGVPAPEQEGILSGFATCFHDRMAESDPWVVPMSCRTSDAPFAADEGIQAVFEAGATAATKLTFSRAVELTLWLEVGVFLLSFLLIFLLPKGPREDQAPVGA